VKSVFLRLTGQTYDNMLARVKRKGFYGLPFDKEGFRMHVLCAMGGNYDGFFRCRYCMGYFTLEQVAVDHASPLSRGGGVELDNLEYPCRACNNRKGSMTPEEYFLLLDFLDSRLPLAKIDVLKRLEISVQLAAADRQRRAKELKMRASL
jgi:5-methylcytosine-specific restriction endonuclease McrA